LVRWVWRRKPGMCNWGKEQKKKLVSRNSWQFPCLAESSYLRGGRGQKESSLPFQEEAVLAPRAVGGVADNNLTSSDLKGRKGGGLRKKLNSDRKLKKTR